MKVDNMYSFSEKQLTDKHGFFKDLGTMAGEQIARGGKYPTYTREYQVSGGSDQLRQKISEKFWSQEETALFGEYYSYTPYYMKVARKDPRNFGKTAHPYLQGGGFFLTLEKTDEQPISYVTQKFEDSLKNSSGLELDKIIQRVNTYGIYSS